MITGGIEMTVPYCYHAVINKATEGQMLVKGESDLDYKLHGWRIARDRGLRRSAGSHARGTNPERSAGRSRAGPVDSRQLRGSPHTRSAHQGGPRKNLRDL